MAHIRVLEVATFYTMFNLVAGRQTSRAALRHHALLAARRRRARRRLPQAHRRAEHVTADGKFSWIEVECLGACVNAPMVQINSDFYEDLTPKASARSSTHFAAGKTPKPGPQIDRQFSAPIGGPTTLTDPSLYATSQPLTTGLTNARRQGPHLHQSLRPARLRASRARARAAPGTAPRRSWKRAATPSSTR